MKFFKPEDFILSFHPEIPSNKWDQMLAANIANAKLEREGRVVYAKGNPFDETWKYENPIDHKFYFKALLINIEPIEKCTHPNEKVKKDFRGPVGVLLQYGYQCECGAKVKPSSFEVCE